MSSRSSDDCALCPLKLRRHSGSTKPRPLSGTEVEMLFATQKINLDKHASLVARRESNLPVLIHTSGACRVLVNAALTAHAVLLKEAAADAALVDAATAAATVVARKVRMFLGLYHVLSYH